MESIKQEHRARDGRKLQASKVILMRKQVRLNTLCHLRQTEASPQIHQHRCSHECDDESLHPCLAPKCLLTIPEKYAEQNEEDQEREDLNAEPSQQDVLPCRRILVFRLRSTDHGRAADLHHGHDRIRADKYSQHHLRWNGAIFPSKSVYQDGEDGVDCCG